MMGVLRAAWLFIAGSRFQRALLAAFPILQGLAMLWYWLDPPCRRCVPVAPVVFDMVSLMCLSGCLLMGSAVFRAMAAPRMLRFIPFARLYLLLGVLFALALLAGLQTLSAALSHRFSPALLVPSGNVYGTFLGAFELMILWVLWGFFLFGRIVWLRWLLVVAAFPAVLVLCMQYRDVANAPDGGVITEFTAIGLAVVIPFVTWFLRARQIEPSDTVGTDWSVPAVSRARRLEALGKSAAVATNVYLLGQPSVVRVCWLWLLCAIAGNIFWLCLMLVPGAHFDQRVSFPVVPLVAICANFFPSQIVLRTRMLWIRGGSSRRELFNRAEKLSLGCVAFVGIPLLVLGAAELTHLSLARAVYLLLLTVSTGLCSLYLTLLDVRDPRFSPKASAFFGVTLVFFLADSFGFLFEQSGPWVPLQVPIAELLAVPFLRAIAVRRWQRIDWLMCKLSKPASQRLRLAR